MISLVDNATNIIVSFLLQVSKSSKSTTAFYNAFPLQAAFFELSMGVLKLVGAGVVLVSVILIGVRQVWKARKTERATE